MPAEVETPTGRVAGSFTGASFTGVLVAALDAAWSAIQARHREVPDVIVTVGSGTLGQSAGETRLGHFAAERWQRSGSGAGPAGGDAAGGGDAGAGRVPELFIGGEGLAAGPERVLATLLHEAGHGLADARGIKDTSRQGRYHNRAYRDLARELGLVCEDAGAHGWTDTRLPPSTAAAYGPVLEALGAALVAFRHPEPGREAGAGKKRGNGVVAACQCPRQFRITASVLQAGPIVCAVCQAPFMDTTPDTGDQDGDQDQDEARDDEGQERS